MERSAAARKIGEAARSVPSPSSSSFPSGARVTIQCSVVPSLWADFASFNPSSCCRRSNSCHWAAVTRSTKPNATPSGGWSVVISAIHWSHCAGRADAGPSGQRRRPCSKIEVAVARSCCTVNRASSLQCRRSCAPTSCRQLSPHAQSTPDNETPTPRMKALSHGR